MLPNRPWPTVTILDPKRVRLYHGPMGDDLGGRLVRAGLLTRQQLARALAGGPAHGKVLVLSLLEGGLSEDALAGFFVADGFGPLLEGDALSSGALAGVLRPEMARGLLALPIRRSPAGLVVAMADPSDRDSVDEIRFAVGSDVLPASFARETGRSFLGYQYKVCGGDSTTTSGVWPSFSCPSSLSAPASSPSPSSRRAACAAHRAAHFALLLLSADLGGRHVATAPTCSLAAAAVGCFVPNHSAAVGTPPCAPLVAAIGLASRGIRCLVRA